MSVSRSAVVSSEPRTADTVWDNEELISCRCSQLYNSCKSFFTPKHKHTHTLWKPINASQINNFFFIKVCEWNLDGRRGARENVTETDREWRSDKTDGGELKLICFFDESGTPRNYILNINKTLLDLTSLLSPPSQYTPPLISLSIPLSSNLSPCPFHTFFSF